MSGVPPVEVFRWLRLALGEFTAENGLLRRSSRFGCEGRAEIAAKNLLDVKDPIL